MAYQFTESVQQGLRTKCPGTVSYKLMRTSGGGNPSRLANGLGVSTFAGTKGSAVYKARLQLDAQALRDPHGERLALTPGMQVMAEIRQGKRTVLEYLLSPVHRAVQEAGRER
jgi:hemolysin D